ncbi:hypothetical protein FKQ51_17650 [Bacillus toyonensis]|nr:hypothetical protein [Bacillus toyonensis]MDO8159149.1 hypothetical protein [Bacillus toyonensis]
MIENPMVRGNLHDSTINNVMSDCESCGKEIYFGEGYCEIDGYCIHDETDCIKQYVESHSTRKIAGE